MAPKGRAAKRKAADEAGSPAKMSKSSAYSGIKDAIEQADLPERCRKMLIAMMPGSLGILSDKRDKYQANAVTMIGEVVDGVLARFQADLDAEAQKVASTEDKKTALLQSVDEAEATVKAASEEVNKKKLALADLSASMLAAKATLREKEQEQKAGNVDTEKAEREKDVLESSVAGELKTLKDNEGLPPAEIKKLYAALTPRLETLSLDESLKKALLEVFTKVPADRGTFGQMVLEQLDKAFADRLAAVEATINEAAPAASARADAVAAAQGALEGMKEPHHAAATALSDAQARHREAVAAAKAAKQAVTDFDPEYKSATEGRDAKKAEMEAFVARCVDPFKKLKEHSSAPAPVPVAAEVAPEATPKASETAVDAASSGLAS